jgi:hypothetical protein
VDRQLVPHLAYAPHLSYPPDQIVYLMTEYVAAQSNLAIEDGDDDRGRMGYDTPYGGSDALVQHRIVRPILLEAGLELGRGTNRAVARIARRCGQPIGQPVAGVYDLVA